VGDGDVEGFSSRFALGDPLRIAIVDIELELSPDDVEGGWGAARSGGCGMACAAVYDSKGSRPYLYDRAGIHKLCEHLESADCVLTWNGKSFDLPIIEAIAGRQLALKEHLDLLVAIAGGRMKGWGLGVTAERTLGKAKSGDGAFAPTLFKEGRIADLHTYCLGDVYLTRDLYNRVVLEETVVGPEGKPVIVVLDGGHTEMI